LYTLLVTGPSRIDTSWSVVMDIWAIDNGYADPERFCIMGGSYDGYAVLAALAFTPSEFSCCVDIVGLPTCSPSCEPFPPIGRR
jgi:hypothetical protein